MITSNIIVVFPFSPLLLFAFHFFIYFIFPYFVYYNFPLVFLSILFMSSHFLSILFMSFFYLVSFLFHFVFVCPLILSLLSLSSSLSILFLSSSFITLFLFLPSLSSSPSFTAGSREDNKSRCGTQQFPARTLSDTVACVFDLSTPTKRSWTRKDMSGHVGKSCAEKNKHMEDVLCVT